MKKIFIVTFHIALVAFNSFGQILFERTYGTSNPDEGNDVLQTMDGGYIVCGYSGAGFPVTQFLYVVKTDSYGDTVWTKKYSLINQQALIGNSITQCPDSGYIITGSTLPFSSSYTDLLLIKINSSGDTLWSKIYSTPGTDEGNKIINTINNTFLIAGSTNGSAWIIKTDANGDSLWSKKFTNVYAAYAEDVLQTPDSGFLIFGRRAMGSFNFDFYLVRTDSLGTLLWQKTYGGVNDEYGYSLARTNDGGYILAGRTYSFGAGNKDIWVLKVSAIGDSLWARTFGGLYDDNCFSVQLTTDGGFILAGWTNSAGAGGADSWIIKINSFGSVQWSRYFGSTGDEGFFSAKQTSDGGYVFAGETNSWGFGNKDVYLVKTDVNGNVVGIEESENISGITIFPNPATNQLTIESGQLKINSIEIYDVLGQKCLTPTLSKGEGVSASIDVSELSAGIYFVKVQGGKEERVVKFVKE